MALSFRKDVASTLEFIPAEGPPTTTAPNLALFNPDNSVLRASGAQSNPTVATTTTAVISVGDRTVALTSAASVTAGEEYWLGTVGTGVPELVQVLSLSGLNVTTVAPIALDHASLVDFRGAKLTSTITAVEAADLDRNYRAEWDYAVGGVTFYATQLFDVVNRVFTIQATPSRIKAEIGDDLIRSMRFVRMVDVIASAVDRIRHELERQDLRPDKVIDTDQFVTCLVERVRATLLGRAKDRDPSLLPIWQSAEEEFRAEFGRIMAARISWYDEDDDLVVDHDGTDFGDVGEEGVQAARYFMIG